MEHKAYVFDYISFQRVLAGRLTEAIERDSVDGLTEFIRTNLGTLTDPYEGEPLGPSWEALIEHRDAHQYGDFALTKFYDPKQDVGLGSDWLRIRPILERERIDRSFLLGEPFGPVGQTFDPGKLGSYFQTPDLVRTNFVFVRSLRSRPRLSEILPPLEAMFSLAQSEGRGLYVTF